MCNIIPCTLVTPGGGYGGNADMLMCACRRGAKKIIQYTTILSPSPRCSHTHTHTPVSYSHQTGQFGGGGGGSTTTGPLAIRGVVWFGASIVLAGSTPIGVGRGVTRRWGCVASNDTLRSLVGFFHHSRGVFSTFQFDRRH